MTMMIIIARIRGEELLFLQGFPVHDLPSDLAISQNQAADLAGNALPDLVVSEVSCELFAVQLRKYDSAGVN